METQTQTTLRDTLATNFDKLDIAGTESPPKVEAEPVKETAEAKAERLRDEAGKFVKQDKAPEKKAEKVEKSEPEPVVETKPRPARPSTWKKDYWEHWDKLDPQVAEYIHQRESEYAKGVSTYKGEYDRLKPLGEAITPYAQMWQQMGVSPDAAIRGLAETDRVLRYGSKEEKLRAIAQFTQDYQIPLHEMLVRGDDGQVYFNQQYFQQQQTAQQSGVTPEMIERLVQQKMQQAAWMQQVQDFRNAKDSSGNPLYSHVAEVEETMAGLLRAGLAKDLPSAYDAALRMPQHAQIYEGQQKQQAEAKAAAEARAKAEQAAKARTNAVSVKGQSPTGVTAGTSKVRKGLRESLSEGVDELFSKG